MRLLSWNGVGHGYLLALTGSCQLQAVMGTVGPFSLGLETREVRVKVAYQLPNSTRKSECDFSNFARNFARCFVMRTHTAEKSWFYSRDFRIRSSLSATINPASGRFGVSYAGNGWTSKLGMRSSSRNFAIFSSELTSRVSE